MLNRLILELFICFEMVIAEYEVIIKDNFRAFQTSNRCKKVI